MTAPHTQTPDQPQVPSSTSSQMTCSVSRSVIPSAPDDHCDKKQMGNCSHLQTDLFTGLGTKEKLGLSHQLAANPASLSGCICR